MSKIRKLHHSNLLFASLNNVIKLNKQSGTDKDVAKPLIKIALDSYI